MDRLEIRALARAAGKNAADYAKMCFFGATTEDFIDEADRRTFHEAFWDRFYETVTGFGPPPKATVPTTLTPMSDDEAREFRKVVLQFGPYEGLAVGNIESPSEFTYLRWLVDDTTMPLSTTPELRALQENLRRYLLRDEFKMTHEEHNRG